MRVSLPLSKFPITASLQGILERNQAAKLRHWASWCLISILVTVFWGNKDHSAGASSLNCRANYLQHWCPHHKAAVATPQLSQGGRATLVALLLSTPRPGVQFLD